MKKIKELDSTLVYLAKDQILSSNGRGADFSKLDDCDYYDIGRAYLAWDTTYFVDKILDKNNDSGVDIISNLIPYLLEPTGDKKEELLDELLSVFKQYVIIYVKNNPYLAEKFRTLASNIDVKQEFKELKEACEVDEICDNL
jgi:hypothetical protein